MARSALYIITLASSLSLLIPWTGAQVINVTSAQVKNGLVCPGMVKFTCTVYGSRAIAWISDEYIAIGGDSGTRISFNIDMNNVGTVRSVGNARANLTFYNNNQANEVLASDLWISVQPNSPSASMTCRNIDVATESTINFQVVAPPSKPQDLIAVQFKHLRGVCVVTAFWLSPNNTEVSSRVRYDVYANDELVANQTVQITTAMGPRISSLFEPRSCDEHNISVRVTNMCGLQNLSSHQLHRSEILTVEETCSGMKNRINLFTVIFVVLASSVMIILLIV